MALAFQAVEKLPSFDLRDPATTLTSKLNEEQVTLQDIALSILTRPVKDRWQRSLAVRDFRELFDLVIDLLKDATAKDISFAQQYRDVFFEFALLIFTALPNEWNEPEQPAEKYFHVDRPTAHELFENKLAETIKALVPLHYRSKTPVMEWEHKLFSIVGMAAATYAETGRESARLLALEAIECYRDVLFEELEKDERVHDDSWDYLQLTSVWTRHLLKDVALADALLDAVAKGRPFHVGSTFLTSSKHGLGSYGYPNVGLLQGDFHIPYPRNIGHRLSEAVKKIVSKRWQDKLMNPDELQDTYKRIQAIREPIRNEIMERYRKEKEKRRPVEAESNRSS